MSDVRALIGKLKANVAYRQFNAPSRESSTNWPVLERIAQAQQGGAPAGDPPEPEAPSPAPEPVLASPPAVAAQVEPPAPTVQPSGASFLRRAKAPPAAPTESIEPVEPRPLARIQPSATSAAPSQPAPSQSGAASGGLARFAQLAAPVEASAPEAAPSGPVRSSGSLLRRYGASPEPAPPAAPPADSRSLTDIFARLEGKPR